AAGSVDHAQHGNRILGILYHLEVGEHVLDLGTVVKREAPNHVIRQVVAAHRFFKKTRLRVGAIEHGSACPLASAGGLANKVGNAVGDIQSFIFTVRGFVVADPGTALARCPQILAFSADVVRNHRRGSFEDVLGGTVVLLQADDLGLGEIFF